MTKILFVCYGNICRSPMAEFIFKNMLDERAIADSFLVRSAATSSEEIFMGRGRPVYPPAKAELAKHGLSCGSKTAVQVTADDYSKYDIIVGMDKSNIRDMLRIFGSDPERKVKKLLDFAGGGDVADPWYTDRFDIAYRDIHRGCSALLDYLLKKTLDKTKDL